MGNSGSKKTNALWEIALQQDFPRNVVWGLSDFGRVIYPSQNECLDSEVLTGGIPTPILWPGPELQLTVPHIMQKVKTEELAEGPIAGCGEWGGEKKSHKIDYEFENCQLSCIIQLRAPWHDDQPQSRFFSLNGFTFKQAN